MSVADQSVPLASVAGRVPFTVRFSPQFVNRMFDRLQKSVPTQANVAGLLFGRMDQDVCEVQVFRSFTEGHGSPNLLSSPDQLSALVEQLVVASRKDPEVSALTLLGWYSFRATGGLHESDVAFHNRFFRQPNEVALILRPEQHPNVLFEIYSKSGTTLLSEEEHRWGSLRLSSGSNVLGPIDVAMRAKIGDDFYLRAYQVSKTLDRAERREYWANAVEATKSTVRSIFRQKRKESYAREATGKDNGNPYIATEPGTRAPQLARAATAVTERSAFSQPAIPQAIPPALPPTESGFGRRTRDYAPAPGRDPAALQRIVAGDPPALPAVIKRPKRGVPWLSSVVVFAIAAGATFALYVQGFANSGDSPHFLRAIFPDTGLGLKVEGQGDRVLLSWNRRNAVVRDSQGGVLHIDDGPQHRDVRLDPAQISNGSVLYRPGSDDVSFRLEVHGVQGAAVVETTRVLDGAKLEPLEAKNATPDVSASAPAATPLPPIPAAVRATQALREDRMTPPLATRSTHAASPPASSITNPASAPEYHPVPSRNSAASPSTSPSAPTTPNHTEPTVPGAVGTLSTSSRPPQSAPSTSPPPSDQRPLPTPSQTTSDTARLSPPAISPDATRPPDTSKVTNWEDVPAPANPVEPAPTRSSPALPAGSSSINTNAAAEAKSAFVPPRPLKQVLPDLRSIPADSIGATSQLEVAVRVNKKGHVSEAYLVGDASKVAPHLARAALSAAKQWTFQPATIRGKNVPSDHTIVFEFRPAGR